MKNTTGKWDDPPPLRPTAYPWEDIARLCRKNPNKWRKVYTQDKMSYATAIRVNGISALRKEKGFVTRTANRNSQADPVVCDLWVKYVPEKDTGE